MPASLRPVAWLCVGPVSGLETAPDLEAQGWRRRRPVAEVVHHNR
ncbi:MAG TPA: hypothetical protein VM942_06915 [Acidimicrobiales bacterium]|nr:hypothetical protein [Acidimicrobiales bacterium]